MPPDVRLAATLALLTPPVAALRAAIASATEEVRGYLALHGSGGNGRDRLERVRAQLGPFAAGRIDAERFAALFPGEAETDGVDLAIIERGLATLTALADRHAELIAARVPPGGSLAAVAEAALAEVGRVFAAVRTVEHVRSGRGRAPEDERALERFPYRAWSRPERRLAPPIVLEVDGADCDAGALAGFLDGAQKIVLVVRGPASPAPLVRLVTPATFVLQAGAPAELERMLHYEGPGIAALVDETSAWFVHDPTAGTAIWARLTVLRLPDAPRRAVGGWSVAQQLEELRQLETLAKHPPAPEVLAPAGAAAAVASADPADKLAAWLLQQADLSDLT